MWTEPEEIRGLARFVLVVCLMRSGCACARFSTPANLRSSVAVCQRHSILSKRLKLFSQGLSAGDIFTAETWSKANWPQMNADARRWKLNPIYRNRRKGRQRRWSGKASDAIGRVA